SFRFINGLTLIQYSCHNYISTRPALVFATQPFGILVLSILPIVGIFTIYTLFITGLKQSLTDFRTPKLSYDVFLLRFWWLWFIFAAYLYKFLMKKKVFSSIDTNIFQHNKYP
ncbi:MAG: hypothetical protein V7K23_16080, partial [Nostoc sp.]